MDYFSTKKNNEPHRASFIFTKEEFAGLLKEGYRYNYDMPASWPSKPGFVATQFGIGTDGRLVVEYTKTPEPTPEPQPEPEPEPEEDLAF